MGAGGFLRAGLAAAMLAGCAETGVEATQAADPAIEPVTGIPKAALAEVAGADMSIIGETGVFYHIYYYADKVAPAVLNAAPARVCRSRGKRLDYARPSAEGDEYLRPAGTAGLVFRCV